MYFGVSFSPKIWHHISRSDLQIPLIPLYIHIKKVLLSRKNPKTQIQTYTFEHTYIFVYIPCKVVGIFLLVFFEYKTNTLTNRWAMNIRATESSLHSYKTFAWPIRTFAFGDFRHKRAAVIEIFLFSHLRFSSFRFCFRFFLK